MDKIVHHSVRLPCSASQAFELFTDNNLLQAWLTELAEVNPVPGGKYELFWEPEDRENNSTIGCRITALEPNKFLSFEWRSPKQYRRFANNADPLTHVVVFFIPLNSGTEIHLLHSGWRSSPEWEEARLWQEKAWETAFGKMKKKLDNRRKTEN